MYKNNVMILCAVASAMMVTSVKSSNTITSDAVTYDHLHKATEYIHDKIDSLGSEIGVTYTRNAGDSKDSWQKNKQQHDKCERPDEKQRESVEQPNKKQSSKHHFNLTETARGVLGKGADLFAAGAVANRAAMVFGGNGYNLAKAFWVNAQPVADLTTGFIAETVPFIGRGLSNGVINTTTFVGNWVTPNIAALLAVGWVAGKSVYEASRSEAWKQGKGGNAIYRNFVKNTKELIFTHGPQVIKGAIITAGVGALLALAKK